MKAYFNNLNERERWALVLGLIALFFFIFYWIIYSPVVTAIEENSLQLKEKQETLQWMQQVRLKHKSKPKPQSITNSQLLTLITNQLHGTSFTKFTYQIQQMGSGDIQLAYEQVPFADFVAWLWAIHQKYAINLKQFTADKTPTAGLAKVLVIVSAE